MQFSRGTRLAMYGVVAFVFAAEVPAFAYIDPGSGSLIYQALLAGLLGLGFTFRRTTASIARLLRRVSGKPADGEAAASPTANRR